MGQAPDLNTDEMIPPDIFTNRRTIQGTKSDILVSAGSGIFTRRKRVFGDDTNPAPYLFAGGGFRDENWFNCVAWEIGAAGKSQFLVFTDKAAYGVRAYLGKSVDKDFQRGNGGHALWAGEWNSARPSDANSRNKVRGLWSQTVPVRFNAMAIAGEILFAAGAADTIDQTDPLAQFEGRADSELWAVNGKNRRKLSEYHMDGSPVHDGMAVTEGHVFVAMKTGKATCFAAAGETAKATQKSGQDDESCPGTASYASEWRKDAPINW